MTSNRAQQMSPPAYPFTPVINLDILALIMTFVEKRQDLLSFMHTCRALYTAGIQPLLRLATDISTSKLQSFHTFMFAHSPASFAALRHLHFVDYPRVAPEHVKNLASLLERSLHLEELKIPSCVLDADPRIPLSISSYKALVSLDLWPGQSSEAESMLSRLHSPLKDLDVSFAHIEQDPVSLLSRFRDTLETACLVNVTTMRTDFSYVKLTKLVLYCTLPQLSILTSAFPNLRTLEIEDDHDSSEPMGGIVAQLGAVRMQNIAFQGTHRSWTSLRSVSTDVDSLYAMGLRNQIDELNILGFLPNAPPFGYAWFHSSLDSLQPKELTVWLHDEDINEEYICGLFAARMDQLVRLGVTMGADGHGRYEDALVMLFRAIEHLDISILDLCLNVGDVARGRQASDQESDPSTQPMTALLDGLARTIGDLLDRHADTMRSLEVFICTVASSGRRWYASFYKEANEDDIGGQKLKQYKASEGGSPEPEVTARPQEYLQGYSTDKGLVEYTNLE
ncbi:hypothetical protein NM688_g4141 [Phlebia brevispora]|uniref:Uncharacterized protein n=1 Tax=Phlebia brevispora TaxID=194682 RepID=A0ACC1T3H4_9APHY|nr:hypothetical protein NM688_g4141 [Phlebia brevispora]